MVAEPMRRALFAAGRFLTRLPWPDPGAVVPEIAGRSALFYPLIGLLIGTLLAALCGLLNSLGNAATEGVVAILALCLWAWLTGGLHLDGLSDAADGWVGGLGSRERTLEIMRDPRAGAMGVIALVLALLAKWATLAALLEAGQAAALIWVPALARAALLVALLSTPYARTSGMASATVAHLPRRWAWGSVLITAVGVAMLGGTTGLVALCVAAVVFLWWRAAVMRRLQGFTGDTAGALVELTEIATLIGLTLIAL